MMRGTSKPLILLMLLGGATVLRGSEEDELREKARVIQKAAAILAELGKIQASERLVMEARELLQEADRRNSRARRDNSRLDSEREVGQLKGRLQDLLGKERELRERNAPEQDRAEVREQIAGTERELNAVRERLDQGGKPRSEFEVEARKIEEAARRIHHMRVASDNLKAAGIHDIAMKLIEKAEVMERDVVKAKERLAKEMDRPGGDPRDAEIRELRKQNEQLQAEMRELRQKLERR